MKAIKYILMIVLTATLSGITATKASAQDKSIQKESKKAANQMNKEGWNVFGNVKSIKEAMDAHYKKLAEGHGTLMSLEGHGTAKDLNVAVRRSQHNAAAQYASMQESNVEGTTETKTNSKSDGENASSDIEVSSQFQSSTDQTVKSLTPSAIFYRVKDDGRYEVRAFYIAKSL